MYCSRDYNYSSRFNQQYEKSTQYGVSCLIIAGADAAAASLVGFGGACGKGRHIAVAFGVAGLNLFFGVTLFLFSVASLFLTLGFISGSGGLNWLTSAGIIGPILYSTSRKVLIFLIMFGAGGVLLSMAHT